ncbi:MAG: DNA methyltransferase [Candidatus Pacebacteria bacterium]|nr:DNA methyltransferase [Candidatus Paceibacterota bacterium]
MSGVSQYISEIQKVLASGDAREHAYRPAFQRLIEGLSPDVQVINEPAYTGGNAPDFLFKRNDVPVAYAECKDVTVDIADKEVIKQAERYVKAFGKILLTNYLEFQIIDESGELAKITIASRVGNTVTPHEENFAQFENLIKDYITPTTRTIRSAKKLAEIMASKARLVRDNSLAALEENQQSEIYSQYLAFKEVLIHDLSPQEFADMYAQTLVYGLFVARYFDESLSDFSRHEAHDLLPSTNPLLKKFFGHVAGTDYDVKIAWMVDSLIEAYKSTNVHELMHKEFENKQKDPVLHFYETFLSLYDQGLRKSRGVYYTPEPIVSFIVRSVDHLLKNKFGLEKGLADTTKIEHEFRVQGVDNRTKDSNKKIKEQIHKVQILDPAVGTGTFLNEVIHEIHRSFKGQEGRWNGYVAKELLPRLHGFELMMASYTMAHLKLGVTLKELGYEGKNERLSVWLTNSLEESVHEVPNLFMSQWLTQESNEASKIKSEMPIMVVVGNPPYAVSSMNPSKDENGKPTHIGALLQDYKKDLNERKINLDDDYIKFIRFAENAIEKTGSGIVAMITNNSFIDGVTHRQMRKHLMETFDEIYILDLHGSATKKEKAKDGGKDENVFAIQQGVSINLFVKTKGASNARARVHHAELLGTQAYKFEQLNKLDFSTTKWKKLTPDSEYNFFVPKDFGLQEKYEKGFKVENLFREAVSGVESVRDSLTIHFDKESLEKVVNDFVLLSEEEIATKYQTSDARDWKIGRAKIDIIESIHDKSNYRKISYRPFDFRDVYYTGKQNGFVCNSRFNVMKHLLKENIALIAKRGFANNLSQPVFITNKIFDRRGWTAPGMQGAEQIFPLYLYHEDGSKTPNLDSTIWQKINETAGETTPEDILDYIYAVLHSPKYRETYKEFLKIDFPRVPYPSSREEFERLVAHGRHLRELHLLAPSAVREFITTFPIGGNNVVEKKHLEYRDGNVYINASQYFGNVPKEVWEFYIGGYQPAQKWLKDRRERTLSDDEIDHYQKMIVSMNETIKVMRGIDGI